GDRARPFRPNGTFARLERRGSPFAGTRRRARRPETPVRRHRVTERRGPRSAVRCGALVVLRGSGLVLLGSQRDAALGEPRQRVDLVLAAGPDLEVQVRAGGAAAVADLGDLL